MRKLGMGCVLALVWCSTGCGGSKEQTRPVRTTVTMSLDEAKQIVSALEAQQAKNNEADPLRKPASMDDLLAILKRDQIDLFAAGVSYAATQEDLQAKALRAQIELAWGDAHLILSELFTDAASRLKTSVRTLSTRSVLGLQSEETTRKLEDMKKTIKQCETVSEALGLTAAEHVGLGARLAEEVIAASPTDYVGYRLAADFYRLRGDWDRFDDMIRKIEETNPESNGLVFLRGTAALYRDGRPSQAADYFRTALGKDPQFTRSQAQLVLSRPTVEDTFGELEKLKALSPNHQIVVWAGPAITAAFNARVAALHKSTPAGATGGTTPPATTTTPGGQRGTQQ